MWHVGFSPENTGMLIHHIKIEICSIAVSFIKGNCCWWEQDIFQ